MKLTVDILEYCDIIYFSNMNKQLMRNSIGEYQASSSKSMYQEIVPIINSANGDNNSYKIFLSSS